MAAEDTMSAGEGLEVNLLHWDEAVALHAESVFYDLPSFLEGNCTLLPIELEEIGDVTDLKVLHLQCHFGLDTLSWARRGANITGIDFSGAAVSKATEIASSAGLEARFVQSEVTKTPEVGTS